MKAWASLCILVAVTLTAAAEDDITQFVTVVRHVDTAFSEVTAKARLGVATTLLRTKDRSTDYASCLNFEHSASVGTFGTSGDTDDIINSEAKLLRVLAISTARVKIVTAVNWCEGKQGSFLGCADEPGNSMVLAASAPADVWAHEFGHNQGLPHRNTSPMNLMHESAANTDEINTTESNALRRNGVPLGTCGIVH